MNRDEAIREFWFGETMKEANKYSGPKQDIAYLLSETSRLRADLAAMTAERDALTNVLSQLNGVMCGVRDERDKLREQINREEHEFEALITQREQERDAAQKRAEAAEADMKHAAEQSERGEPSSICVICEDFERDDCGGETCHFKWRGPVAGNKPKTLTEAITKEINKEATTP